MPARKHIEDVLYGRKSAPLLGAVLGFLSLLYGMALSLRAFAYGKGLFRTRRLPCMVISVGNITLGGTGKTPAVIHIAEFLQKRGVRPVIVSRGYGRADASGVGVVSDGLSLLLDADRGGDEPVQMARRLPQVPVVVGSDRSSAGMLALERFSPDAVIVDDGFQHLGLARDLNIALIDGTDPFGTGRLFPAGILREPLAGLQRADAVIITNADRAPDVPALQGRIKKHTAAAVFTARHVPRCLVRVATDETRPLDALRGAKVFAFAGIARPAALEELLRSLGADVRGMLGFPDHHRFRSRELDGLRAQAGDSGASMLVTTEKDAARLQGMRTGELWALRIDLEVVEKEAWEKLLGDTV